MVHAIVRRGVITLALGLPLLGCGVMSDDAPGYGDTNLAAEIAALRDKDVESIVVRRNEVSDLAIGPMEQSKVPGFLACLGSLKGLDVRPPGESHIYFEVVLSSKAGVKYEIQGFRYSGDPAKWIVAVFHRGGYCALFDGGPLYAWMTPMAPVAATPP